MSAHLSEEEYIPMDHPGHHAPRIERSTMTDHERDYLRERVDKVAEEQAAQHGSIKSIAEDCSEIKKCLKGNGQPGLTIRTDRLEQKEKTRSRLLWMVISGVVILLLNAAASHFGIVAH